MALPVQTPEQQQESLRKANEARAARSAALKALKAGEVTMPEVLADKESPLQRAFVRQLLLALPGVGKVRADLVLERTGIDPRRRVRGLGERQRKALEREFATSDA